MSSEFITGVLQARTTSSRLPGKALEPVMGQPMILRQLDRVRRAELLDLVVVATSEDESDDELASILIDYGCDVVRGSLENVLARFLRVMDEYEPDAVVRLTADCPLASPAVIDAVVGEFMALNVDYLSNTLEPTFPDGLDVEVVRPAALRWVADHSEDIHEREHVTLGVYRRPEQFKVMNFAGPRDLSALRWTVDTPEDLAFVREVYEHLYPNDPLFDLDDVLALLEEMPHLSRTSMDAARNAALDGLDTGAMKHG